MKPRKLKKNILSYGANTIRDGVSLNNLDKKQTLVLPTEISNLQDLECYIKLPGNLPITKLLMKYKNIPSTQVSFVDRPIELEVFEELEDEEDSLVDWVLEN